MAKQKRKLPAKVVEEEKPEEKVRDVSDNYVEIRIINKVIAG